MEVRTTCPLNSSRLVLISLSKSKTPKTRITTDTIKIHEFFSTSIEANEKDNIIFSFTTKRYDEHRHTSFGVIVVVVILIGTVSSAFCLKVFGRIQSPVHCVICVWGKCCAMNRKDIMHISVCVCVWVCGCGIGIHTFVICYSLIFWHFLCSENSKTLKDTSNTNSVRVPPIQIHNTNTPESSLICMHIRTTFDRPSDRHIYLHIQTDRQNIVYVHIYTYERTFR